MNNSIHQHKITAIRQELAKAIIGQSKLIDRLLIALLVEGHVLLEGVPGLAKTRTLMCLSQAISGQMNRIQFTPDLLPADIIGTETYRPQTGEFVMHKGPVFANLLLADEINRAPAKVQSALLEAMAEKHVSIAGIRHKLPKPFLVLATQNPIEQSGTYELPEAQLDRFLMKLNVDYPTFEDELKILDLCTRAHDQDSHTAINAVVTPEELLYLGEEASLTYIDPRIDSYIVRLVHATRHPAEFGLQNLISWGASPRASIALKQCARASAYLKEQQFVSPDDIKELSLEILRHRIILTFDAIGDGVTTDEVIKKLLSKIPSP
jgi:MoxR-like ATPase